MEVALKNVPESGTDPKGKTTREKYEKTLTDELIIGICSPIGSFREEVIEAIKNRIHDDYEYEFEIIKLSDLILEYSKKPIQNEIGKTPKFSELTYKIKEGNELREKYKNNSIMAELAIKKIREDRKGIKTEDLVGRRKCYLIDSLKNIEELHLLRSVYREIFYLFSIFSSESERKENLIKKGLSNEEVEIIIDKDDLEDLPFGQNVRNIFPEADFFVRVSKSNKGGIDKKIERYLHLILESAIITPNFHEIAMYHAKSASGNSACLSRQVGAAITDSKGITLAKGWNDVPKFGGNLYRETDNEDIRCLKNGFCQNDKLKFTIVEEIIDEIKNSGLFESNKKADSSLKIINNEGDELAKIRSILKKSRIKHLTEYSRAIHAEMHAIITGSQMTGDKMVGGNLYCTTYPCHNCARHIILAGIKNIYYIEPYKKSLGIVLHNDALTEDEKDDNKVRILLYEGVSPRRYIEFFAMNRSRKNSEGVVLTPDLKIAVPKNRLSLQAIPELENQAIHSLHECGLLVLEDEEVN